ncbi:hypothetical protein JCM3765_006448 [Sporobolomyces pararoseus]
MSSKDLVDAQKPCNFCKVPSPLRCARCTVKYYCTPAHQKEDWPEHKLVCKTLAKDKKDANLSSSNPTPQVPRSSASNSNAKPPKASRSKKTDSELFQEFFAMFPEGLTKEDCYHRIIDSYRLWLDDSYKFQGSCRGIYAEEDPLPEFSEYLKMARPYLPEWWNSQSANDVWKMAVLDDWSNLNYATSKDDIYEHYSPPMPIIFRQFASQVTGSPMGSNDYNDEFTTAWQYPGGSRKVVTVPSWARNLPPDELSDEGHELAATDPSPRRPNNPNRGRSLSSVFRQNRSSSFTNNIPLNTTAYSTARAPNLANSTASTSSSPIPPFPDSIRSPEPTHTNPASTTIHRSQTNGTTAPGGDKGWWTFTLPSKYLDRVHGYIHPKEWNEKGKERADLPHRLSEEEDDTRSLTSQRSMRSGWSMRSGRRPSRSREQEKQEYHRKMTQSMKINLGPPNIFSINQATTPGWASPWQPFERSQEDRRMQDPFDISQQQTAAVEASRKSRFENFILHNPFSPLFFRIINLVLVTCTLALAGHIRRQEERAAVVGVIGTSTLFVLVIAPIAIIHIFITLYIEYFGAPIGLWQIRTKMFYTLTDLVLICLYSSALSLSLDDLFTSSLECTAYTPYRRYNSPSPSVVGEAGIDGTLADQICSQQIAQVVFIFLSVFIYLAVLIISLFRIFAKVSRK